MQEKQNVYCSLKKGQEKRKKIEILRDRLCCELWKDSVYLSKITFLFFFHTQSFYLFSSGMCVRSVETFKSIDIFRDINV